MIEFIIFAIRYIPFWCVPGILIFLPFAYIFWLKDVKFLFYIFLACAGVCTFFITFWVWAGGPDKATEFFFNAVRSF